MEKRRINVRAVIWRDGKILAVKHRNEDDTPTDHWALPGGGLDPMESLADAVAREVLEELGVVANVGRLIAGQQFTSNRTDFDEELELFFQVDYSSEFESIDLTNTSHGVDELAGVAFIDPKKEFVLPEFLQVLDVAGVIDGNAPVVVENYL